MGSSKKFNNRSKKIDYSLYESIVNDMVKRLMPQGYDMTSLGNTCDTLDKITQYYMTNKRLLIWNGASDNTIFNNPQSNLDFRAWHDFIHITENLAFTPEGEKAVCRIQQLQVIKYYSDMLKPEQIKEIILILEAEINEQVNHFEKTGEFIQDQKAFTDFHVKRLKKLYP